MRKNETDTVSVTQIQDRDDRLEIMPVGPEAV